MPLKFGDIHSEKTGGEPFTREDCCDLIDYIREKGLGVIVLTNGTLLNEEKLFRLKKANIDLLDISIDSPSQEIYKVIRRKDLYQKVTQNIKSATQMSLPVSINFTLSKRTIGDMNLMYKLASDLGAIRVSVNIFRLLGRGQKFSNSSATRRVCHCEEACVDVFADEAI